MQCRNCGAELEPEALYCQDCGMPVDGAPARTPYQNAQSGYMPAQVKMGRRVSGRNIAIGVICVAAIVGMGFGAATVLGLGNHTSQMPESSSAQVVEASSSSASAESESVSSASAESSESSSSASAEPEGFNQMEVEAQVRKEAQAAGMQVFTGTVHMTTFGERASEVDKKLVSGVEIISDRKLALFTFAVQEAVTATSADNLEALETRYNQDNLSLGNPGQWEELDGQLITVAAYPEDMIFPNDIAGSLYSAYANVEVIAPLDEQSAADVSLSRKGLPEGLPALPTSVSSSSSAKSSASSEKASSESAEKSSSSAAAASGDYVLPNSASTAYSRSDLSKLSDYELFIARNEIYARHGRKFQNQELQKYFESKSWYKGTADAGTFDESVLSDVEIDNAATIRAEEEARNSKYL